MPSTLACDDALVQRLCIPDSTPACMMLPCHMCRVLLEERRALLQRLLPMRGAPQLQLKVAWWPHPTLQPFRRRCATICLEILV